MQNQSHLLKSRRFLPLFITQFFGAFNDNAFKNAFLIWFTYDIAHKLNMNAEVMVTAAAGLFILPFFLFSALAGQFADKYDKAKLAQLVKLLEIILMGLSFVGFYLESVGLLLVLLFMMGVHSTFFGPLKYSLLPENLHDNELVSGNAFIEGATFLAILLGTIMGGLIIRTEHGIEIISIIVVSLSIIGWLSSRFIPASPKHDADLKISYNIFTQTWKIVKYAREENSVWLSILGISWFWLIGVTFLSQFPTYTKNIINGDEHVVTLFLSIFSIGIGVGSVMCNRLLKGEINGRMVPFGSIGMTIGIIIFCAASYFYRAGEKSEQLLNLTQFLLINPFSWLIIFSLLMIAVFAGIYIVPLYSIMQHRSDKKYLSRIIAANNVLNALFMVFASIGTVILFSLGMKILEVFLLVGIVNILVFLVIKKIVKRRLGNA
jgi:acyl-[acyl-carrier-protein]-phospholipid O-acyltransferase / long-chain-fatty-acid--[acyl-carrier-protein] ligase